MKRVTFICTGNSCRSQMAEGWAKSLASDVFIASSAGIEAHGLNPRAVASMKRAGVDISRQTSKLIDLKELSRADIVITLCGEADETCPAVPARVHREHWPLPDPARATGSEEEISAMFDRVRDEIRRRVEQLVAEYR